MIKGPNLFIMESKYNKKLYKPLKHIFIHHLKKYREICM